MKTRAGRQAFRLALIYVIAGGAWVAVSEAVLKRLTSSLDECFAVGAIQALVFVVVTGGFLYLKWRHLLRQWERELEQREESQKHLRRTERALKTISACNGVLVRATNEATLLSEICRVVVEQGGHRLAWVGFPNHDDQKSVRVAARAGYDHGYLQQSRITWSEADERGRGPVGAAIRGGQIIVCNDFLSDPPGRALARQGDPAWLCLHHCVATVRQGNNLRRVDHLCGRNQRLQSYGSGIVKGTGR